MISFSIEDPQLPALIPELRAWADQHLGDRQHSSQDFYADLHPPWFGYELADVDGFLDSCPLARQWLADRGLSVRHLALITLDAHKTSPLHRDRLLPGQNPWALNFNIRNCEQTWTEAYRVTDQQGQLQQSEAGDQLLFYRAEPHLLISRWNLAKPRLFNTQIAHRVVNDTDLIRQALSMRFWTDPVALL